MKAVTYKEFLRLKPCWLKDGRAGQLAEIGARKEWWTALDVLKLGEVEAVDRLWAVLREEFIDAPILHEFACRCAERALTIANVTDERCWNAIRVKRAWLKGAATGADLAAAWDVAWDAARDAARDAAWAAAWDAARAAARDAARDAELKWQIAELKKLLGRKEVRKCRKCGAVLTALEGVQIEMRKRKRWITLDIPLCEKHGRQVYEAATAAACGKVREMEEAGE